MVFGKPLPGETPIDEISGLKVKGIRHRDELNLLEGQNIAKAIEKYLLGELNRRRAPFDYFWALELHREMFGDVWDWAGVPRKTNLDLGVDFLQVEPRLYELMAALALWQDRPWVDQAADLHYQAVAIHPFLNGNGRWSRMLANLWLHVNEQPFTLWPDSMGVRKSDVRETYIAAVQAADGGDLGPLIDLHRRFTPSS
jgi:fido (protein-threonine AMPylation protein)